MGGGQRDVRGGDDGGAPPTPVEVGSASELCALLRPGDVLLVGHRGRASRLTQWVTASNYGHAIFYVGEEQFLESTDRSFTPWETDDGVFQLSADHLFAKMVEMTSAVVLRPELIDPDRVREVAEEMAERAASYPTASIPLIGLSCLAARGFHRLPGPLRRRLAELIVVLVADGVSRMHCTELVMRIYAALGQPIELRDPVLKPVIEAASESSRRLFAPRWHGPIDLPRRKATEGTWPPNRVLAAAMATVWLVAALRARVDSDTERHEKELVVPGDLVDAPTFKVAIPLRCRAPAG